VLSSSETYNNILFVALLLVSFFGLLHLGELVYPNDKMFDQPKKMICRSSVHLQANSLHFQLPFHKADCYFKGNTVLILPNNSQADPITATACYLLLCNKYYPERTDMWIQGNGDKLRRYWFIKKLKSFGLGGVASHSLHSGGAMALAENSIHLEIILFFFFEIKDLYTGARTQSGRNYRICNYN
jgi:hypothetical protein